VYSASCVSVRIGNDVTQVMTKIQRYISERNSSSIVRAGVYFVRSSYVLCEFIFFLELGAVFLYFVII